MKQTEPKKYVLGAGIEKVFLPVDFSKPSIRAIEFAIKLFSNKNVNILLMHVIPYFSPTSFGEMPSADLKQIESFQKDREKSKIFLDNAKNHFMANGISKVNIIITNGEPVKEIIKKIKEFEPDIIVVGNRGRGFGKGILFGSVSQKIAANAKVPVLIVK